MKDGSGSFSVNIDCLDQNSKKLVLFQYLYCDGNLIATDADINNENQTIYVPELSRNASIVKISNDKFNTAELLEKYDIPQPKFCLINSNDCTKEDHSKLESKIKKLYSKVNDDTKFVCKILHGHGGKGVFLCKMSNIVSICQCIFKLDNSIKLLVQEYKQIKDGDIRVNVVSLNGKQKIFDVSMRCHHANDFRTNLSLGNTLNISKLETVSRLLL